MKRNKRVLLVLVVICVSVLVGYICLQLLIVGGNAFYQSQAEKFDYNSAKEEVTKYLKENKKELEKIADKLYENKSSKKKPYKYIRSVSYRNHTKYGSSIDKSEYVEFNIDYQGLFVVGGQDYGLIYSKNKNIYEGENLVIYDQYKETGEGNNIYIREKISDHWYFYYNDLDGKVNINNIQ